VAERAVRLAEVVASLAAAADLGLGLPLDHGLRTALIAMRLADQVGLADRDREDLFYLTLLRMSGCTVESPSFAYHFGDEVRFGADTQALDYGNYQEFGAWVMAHFAADQDAPVREQLLARLFEYSPEKRRDKLVGHCEVAQLVAREMGLGAAVGGGLTFVFERWDGTGAPAMVGGERIPLIARVMHLANEVEVHARLHGPEAAVAMAEHRAGGAFDPGLVRLFRRSSGAVLAVLEARAPWEAAMAADPGKRELSEAGLDRAAGAVADFADLKSDYTHAHSRGVAGLVEAAAAGLGRPAEEVALLRRGALLHDLGRVSVSAGVWDKSGPLTDADWETVRLHAYYTERVLSRAASLRPLAAVAGLHHERLDASGYHRGCGGAALSPGACLLAAADAYQAMTEDRAHRPALDPDAAAAQLRREAEAGRLDAEAVRAVLAAAGHPPRPVRQRWPHDLTAREVDVLRLLATGLSMREMGARLHLSPKTVDNHIQHIYGKLGVSTRAAATVVAMQDGLVLAAPTRE
jgi:HD-GYP domain-containing protein (c-di-GMP phosphodiesterase class II)